MISETIHYRKVDCFHKKSLQYEAKVEEISCLSHNKNEEFSVKFEKLRLTNKSQSWFSFLQNSPESELQVSTFLCHFTRKKRSIKFCRNFLFQ